MGHQGSHAPGRPVLHLVSSSRRPRQENGTMSSLSLLDQCSSFVRAMRPFHRPGLQLCGASRAGAVKAGRRAWLSTTSAFPGHALTAPSTVPRSRRLGRHRVCPGTFEVTSLVENRPCDAGELVGERDRQHVMMQPLLGGFDPGFKPVAFPALLGRCTASAIASASRKSFFCPLLYARTYFAGISRASWPCACSLRLR